MTEKGRTDIDWVVDVMVAEAGAMPDRLAAEDHKSYLDPAVRAKAVEVVTDRLRGQIFRGADGLERAAELRRMGPAPLQEFMRAEIEPWFRRQIATLRPS